MVNVHVSTAGAPPGTYEVRARAGNHVTTLDEKSDVGGADRGPSPMETFLTALASCAAITATMYARRKGWPLEGVEVDAVLEPAGTPGETPRVVQTLTLRGTLDAEQRERLREIAGRCPVHRLAAGPTRYEERLA
jgi:putative redox protein